MNVLSPLVYASAALVTAGAAMISTWIPSRAAARMNTVAALRSE